MRLSCPNCQTEYDVPDAALTGRSRKLRCAECMTTWIAPALEMYREDPTVPAAFEPEPAAVAATESEVITAEPETEIEPETVVAAEPAMDATDAAMATDDAPEAVPERVSMLRVSRDVPATMVPEPAPNRGLKISIGVVLLIIVVILLAHHAIGHAWPPSQRIFNALGLH